MSECKMCGKAFAPLFAYKKSRYSMIARPQDFCEECNAARLQGCKTCAYYAPAANPKCPEVYAYRRHGPHCRLYHITAPALHRPLRHTMCADWKRGRRV